MKEVNLKKRFLESEASYQARVKEAQKAQKEANFQNRLASLTNEINELNKKRSNSARHINNYEMCIKEQIERLKKNSSKSTVTAVTRMLQLLFAKKLVTERYSEAIENKVEELKICRRELQTSRGEEIIDNALIERLNEEVLDNDEVMSYLSESTFNLDNLFRAYENSSLISGDLRNEVNDAVKSSIMSALNTPNTPVKNEEVVEKNDVMTSDEIDALINSLK